MKKKKNSSCLGLFIIRLTLAILFIPAGISKLMGLSGFAGAFNLPLFIACLVALVELAAGIMLLLGVWTRWAGGSLAVIMLGAILIAHNPITMAGELMNAQIRLVILGASLSLYFTGSGSMALLKD